MLIILDTLIEIENSANTHQHQEMGGQNNLWLFSWNSQDNGMRYSITINSNTKANPGVQSEVSDYPFFPLNSCLKW